MRNILSFDEYKLENGPFIEENVLLTNYFLDDMLLEAKGKKKKKKEIEKGILGKLKKRANERVSTFVKQALAEEIKMGKELDKSIHKALKSLNDYLSEMDDTLGKKDDGSKDDEYKDITTSSERLKKIKKILTVSKNQTYGVEELINDGGIDFVGFMNNMTFANFRCFGVMFSPITNTVLLRKCYNYFFGIIKQMIRKDLLIINLNFNYFENLILTKTHQSEDVRDYADKIEEGNNVIRDFIEVIVKTMHKSSDKKYIDRLKTLQNQYIQAYKAQLQGQKDMMGLRSNMYSEALANQYDNTYTKSFETMKQLALEDSQKQLEAIKTSMQKIAQIDSNDPEMATYVEMIISMAEENAYKASAQINNKFIKLCEAFNLENQMHLIKLIQKANEENEIIKKIKIDKAKEKEANEKLIEAMKASKKILEGYGVEIELDTDDVNNPKVTSAKNIEDFVYEDKESEWEKLSNEDKKNLELFFYNFPDVREGIKDVYFRVHFSTPDSEDSWNRYAEYLVDSIGPCLVKNEPIHDSYSVMDFDSVIEEEEEYDKSLREKVNGLYNWLNDVFKGKLFPHKDDPISDKEVFNEADEDDGLIKVTKKKPLELSLTRKCEKKIGEYLVDSKRKKDWGIEDDELSDFIEKTERSKGKKSIEYVIDSVLGWISDKCETKEPYTRRRRTSTKKSFYLDFGEKFDIKDDIRYINNLKNLFCYHKHEDKKYVLIDDENKINAIEHAFHMVNKRLELKMNHTAEQFMKTISLALASDRYKTEISSEVLMDSYNDFVNSIKSYFLHAGDSKEIKKEVED